MTEQSGLPCIDFTAKDGAKCPKCGVKMAVVRTLGWEDHTRERYHECKGCEIRARSVEVDNSVPPASVAPSGASFRADPRHPLSR